MRLSKPPTLKMLLYAAGFRPKPGTLFYSPSLNHLFAARALNRGISQGIDSTKEAQHKQSFNKRWLETDDDLL